MKNTILIIVAIPLLLLALTGIWYSIDGLRLNMAGAITSVNIKDLEQKDFKNLRLIEVAKGIALGKKAYLTDDYDGSISDVIYPVVSDETITQSFKGKQIVVKVIAERKVTPECIHNDDCITFGEIKISGYVVHDVDFATQKKIESLKEEFVGISDHYILIREGSIPLPVYQNVVILLFSVLVSAAIIIISIRYIKTTNELIEKEE